MASRGWASQAVLVWALLVAMLVLLVVRLDGQLDWRWPALLTPVWLLDVGLGASWYRMRAGRAYACAAVVTSVVPAVHAGFVASSTPWHRPLVPLVQCALFLAAQVRSRCLQ